MNNSCKVCGSHRSYYRVGTSPDNGPQASFADMGRGIYCFAHAVERAADLTPAWKARRQAKLARSAAVHAEWLARYEASRKEAVK